MVCQLANPPAQHESSTTSLLHFLPHPLQLRARVVHGSVAERVSGQKARR